MAAPMAWINGEEGELLLAHNHALTALHYDIDSEEYWNYLAERVGKPLAEVREYWQRNPNYTNNVAPARHTILGLAAAGSALAVAAAGSALADTDTDADVVANDASAAAPAAADDDAGAAVPAAANADASAASPDAANADVGADP